MTARLPDSQRKIARKRTTEFHGHGVVQTPEYRAWAQMIYRCGNPSADCFANYGGRGIRVCASWRESFAAFLADVGPRLVGHSLDRINNDGHYEPGNVRWATRSQQNNNHRRNHVVTVAGVSESLTLACRRIGLGVAMIRNRMSRHDLTAAQAIAMGPSRRSW